MTQEIQPHWETTMKWKSPETIKYHTFAEAFAALYTGVFTLLGIGDVRWENLETACHINHPSLPAPLDYYDARDRAYDEGIMVDGKLQPVLVTKAQS